MERDEAVIEAVREYPCLYNSRSSEYKVQSKKENAWTAIAELLERSVEDCQKRWKTLRERFVKEMKRKKTKSGQGAVISCPPWELLNQMEFLREFVKHRKSEGNMEPDAPIEVETQPVEEEEHPILSPTPSTSQGRTPTPQPPPSKKKRVCDAELELDKEILKQLKREQTPSLPPDEDDLFGRSIGATLKTMSPQQKALVKMRIQVMYEVQYCSVAPPNFYPPTENSNF